MDSDLLYCGQIFGIIAIIFPFICPFFLSFKAKIVSQFSQEPCKPESRNMVFICRMSDCIMGLRLKVLASMFLVFIFLSLYTVDSRYLEAERII